MPEPAIHSSASTGPAIYADGPVGAPAVYADGTVGGPAIYADGPTGGPAIYADGPSWPAIHAEPEPGAGDLTKSERARQTSIRVTRHGLGYG